MRGLMVLQYPYGRSDPISIVDYADLLGRG